MVTLSDDGWVSLPGPGPLDGLHVRVKVSPSGRIVITDLYLHGEEIDAEAMRGVTPAQVLATIRLGTYPDPLHRARPSSADSDLTLGRLRRRAKRTSSEPTTHRARLSRPDGSDPETFYGEVARAYNELVAAGTAPAPAIAAEADVPVTTAHRWVREARRRGHLPPARKGSRG